MDFSFPQFICAFDFRTFLNKNFGYQATLTSDIFYIEHIFCEQERILINRNISQTIINCQINPHLRKNVQAEMKVMSCIHIHKL